jgi:hypothetical protein
MLSPQNSLAQSFPSSMATPLKCFGTTNGTRAKQAGYLKAFTGTSYEIIFDPFKGKHMLLRSDEEDPPKQPK